MEAGLRVCDSVDDLARRAAGELADTINDAVRSNGQCAVALAGGATPRPLYRLLASDFRQQIPWTSVHVFWGDERFVAAGDPRRNEAMIRDALIDRVPCPASNVHPVPAHATSADEAARQYEADLRHHFAADWPRFDLVLLGLGADGHTASLFPGSPALNERTRWAVAATVPADPPERVTLTFPVFNAAASVHVLVTGSNKADALRRVFGGADPRLCPAAGVHPAGGVVWWMDRGAAQALEKAG